MKNLSLILNIIVTLTVIQLTSAFAAEDYIVNSRADVSKQGVLKHINQSNDTAKYQSAGYEYEKLVKGHNIVHILKIDPNSYSVNIVKANRGEIGRETVSSMAKLYNADIAINGGFFDIGGDVDGAPSGTLVIDGKSYRVVKKKQPLVLINSGKLSIRLSTPLNYNKKAVSMVSGIPMLIDNGKIISKPFYSKRDFYSKAHARTALGISSDNKIIIVVAEHYYLKDIAQFTMGELQSLIKQKGSIFAQKYNKDNPENINLKELKEILRNEFIAVDKTQGLSIPELAELMKNLGCGYALNLDGGGSSTLWVGGKVINTTIGDSDEAAGEEVIRPVSDAIIFKKNK